MISQSQEGLDACTSGDFATLRLLCGADNNQHPKSAYRESATGPPPVNSMLVAAITQGHVDVVALILQTYSKHRVQFFGETIDALVNHPNLDILQVLYDYDPSVVSFEWDNHTDTFVTKACEQPPEKITPLLLWLIEHDADLEGGYVPRTLCNAIVGGQTLDVIEAMVKKGVRVSTLAMRQAVVCERIDVIEFFMSRKMKLDTDDAEYLRNEAEQTGNAAVVELVKEWTSHKSCVVS
jgi:hypothetical protein